MSRTECAHEQDWPLFSLGVIEPERRAEMQQHLDDGCSQCVAAHQEWAELVPLIGLAAPERRPSQDAESRLEQRLRQPRAANGNPGIGKFGWVLATAAMVAMVAIIAGLGVQRGQLRDELAGQRRQISLFRDQTERLRTVIAKTSAAPFNSPDRPVPPPLPVVVKDVQSARREQIPAVAPPAAFKPYDRSQTDQKIADLLHAQEELSARLKDTERRAQLLEQQLRSAKDRNNQLQESAATSQKLSEEVARLRSELRQSGDSRAEYERLLSVVSAGPIRSIELRAIDPAAHGASARAILNSNSGLFLIADRMPTLPANKCYQLWVIRKSNPSIVSGGIMQLNADGVAILAAPHLSATTGITGLAITDEPAGGSVFAQGHKLLFGAL